MACELGFYCGLRTRGPLAGFRRNATSPMLSAGRTPKHPFRNCLANPSGLDGRRNLASLGRAASSVFLIEPQDRGIGSHFGCKMIFSWGPGPRMKPAIKGAKHKGVIGRKTDVTPIVSPPAARRLWPASGGGGANVGWRSGHRQAGARFFSGSSSTAPRTPQTCGGAWAGRKGPIMKGGAASGHHPRSATAGITSSRLSQIEGEGPRLRPWAGLS